MQHRYQQTIIFGASAILSLQPMTRSSMQERAGICIDKRKSSRHVAGRPGYSGEACCKSHCTVTKGMHFGPEGPMVETFGRNARNIVKRKAWYILAKYLQCC